MPTRSRVTTWPGGRRRAPPGAAAIEVVDSRIVDWRRRIADTVADNGGAARVVLGAHATPVRGLDLRLLGVLFSRNAVPVDSGAGAAALGHPAAALAWLANTLSGF